MYDSVLLPVDGSEGATEALEHAVGVATAHGATLHILYVVDQRVYMAATEESSDDVLANLEAEGEDAVGDAADRAAESGIDAVTAVREGVPHREILAYADETDAAIVVMGTHGRTGRDKLARLGSVTERVVKNADRPVLVVDIGDGD